MFGYLLNVVVFLLQVIALICYLMEKKNDRGPFLVVVPSSVLPGWDSEISFWAPSVKKITYSGPPEERRKLFKYVICLINLPILNCKLLIISSVVLFAILYRL